MKQRKKWSIAFKYNYCDGNGRWFSGICSNSQMKTNVSKARWCSNKDSQCYNHIKKGTPIITRGFVCYERLFLKKWIAYAGVEKSGHKIPIKRDCSNKIAIMTTRDPGTPEKDRFIFAVFVVDSWNYGNGMTPGNVSSNKSLKFEISPAIARTIKFWNYYKTKSGKQIWGCRLHRYLDDELIDKLLNDLYKKHNIKEAKDFLDHLKNNQEKAR